MAALRRDRLGLIDNWLRHIQDVYQKHETQLNVLGDISAIGRRLCQLNVIEQVLNVCRTTIVQDAWHRKQELAVHGWIYALDDGLLRDLNTTVTNTQETARVYQRAIAALR